MDVRSIALTANTPVRHAIPHRFFMLIDAAAALTVRALAPHSLSYTDEVGRDVEASYKYFPLDPSSGKSWGGYELLSTVNQTVTVATSSEQGDYQSFLQTVRFEQADTLTTAADQAVSNAAVQIAAANADRLRIVVQNVGANDVRVGDSNVAAGRGVRLVAGGSMTLQTTAAVYAIREDASDSSVAVIEESRS